MSLSARLRELLEFDAALLANTIGYIDPTPPEDLYLGGTIQCQTPGFGPMAGVAVTCELDASSPGGTHDMGPFFQQLEQIERLGAPAVWVVKAVGSRPDHECVLGDGSAKLLHRAGCVGMVTDGGVRDVAGLASIPFHAFARGRVIHHAAMRFRALNQPVEVGGLTIRTGDILHGSVEGVIRIPPACLDRLPERAAKMRAFEHEAHFVFRQPGLPLAEVRERVKALLGQYGFSK
ncbi:MAG: RraA family protein [Opitutaceae bacterium]|nr:RraA family protein [Opitutaceae bacterium]